mmetsp:Transcript_2089/g.6212  ORF Transcript_2089/g.6212 Transcript_2089/m.6212 type:complete len:247 (-) Transcript_2089:1196-1936(-)
MILHEGGRVVRVAVFHQEKLLEGHTAQRQHRGSQLLHLRIIPGAAPQEKPVQQIHFLGRRLLIFPIAARDYAPAPRMQGEPIKVPEAREKRIIRTGVRRISDEVVDVRDESVVLGIRWHELRQNGRRDDEVPEVVMVVVVARVSEVSTSLTTNVVKALAARDASPILVVITPHWGPCAIPRCRAVVQALKPVGQQACTSLCFAMLRAKEFLNEQAHHRDLLKALAAEVIAPLEHRCAPVHALQEPI